MGHDLQEQEKNSQESRKKNCCEEGFGKTNRKETQQEKVTGIPEGFFQSRSGDGIPRLQEFFPEVILARFSSVVRGSVSCNAHQRKIPGISDNLRDLNLLLIKYVRGSLQPVEE